MTAKDMLITELKANTEKRVDLLAEEKEAELTKVRQKYSERVEDLEYELRRAKDELDRKNDQIATVEFLSDKANAKEKHIAV